MHASKIEQVSEDHNTSRKHRWRDKLTSKVHNLARSVNEDIEDDGVARFLSNSSPSRKQNVELSKRPITTPTLAASALHPKVIEEGETEQLHLYASPERWKPLRKNKGYRVRFDPQPPAIIGIGGDETEMPTATISNARIGRDTDQLVGLTDQPKKVTTSNSSQEGKQKEHWALHCSSDSIEIGSSQRFRLPRRPTGLVDPAPASSAHVAYQGDSAFISKASSNVSSIESIDKAEEFLQYGTLQGQVSKPELSEGARKPVSVSAPEKAAKPALKYDDTDSPLEITEFERLTRHLYTKFEHSSFGTQLERKPNFDHCIRAAVWWFLRGRGELESYSRNTTAYTGSFVGIDSAYLNQAHIDLAKAWWLVRKIIPSHPESSRIGGTEAIPSNSDLGINPDAGLASLPSMYLETISGMRALAKSMEKNHRLPLNGLQTRGFKLDIWFYSPNIASGLGVLKPVVSHSTPEFEHDMASYLPIPLGDTKRHFNFGRMFVDVSLVTEGAAEYDSQVPCILSILRARKKWPVEVAITSQDNEINLLIQSDHRVGPTWEDVLWNSRKRMIRISLPSKMHLHIEFIPQDYKTLRYIYEYTQKVFTELTGSTDEEIVFESRIVDFQKGENGVLSKTPFPTSGTGYILRLFEKILVFAEGTDQREIFHGYRLMVVTPPEHKVLTTFNRVVGQQTPILFNYLKGEGDAPALLIETLDREVRSSSVIQFTESSHRESFLTVLDGTALQKSEVASSALPLKGLRLYSTTDATRFSFGEGVQWQQLRVIDTSSGKTIDQERNTVFSENLRICANCSVGAITDRVNLGPRELLLNMSIENLTAIKLYRCAQQDMTFCIVKNLVTKEDRAALAQVSQAASKSTMIHEYSFQNLQDLHIFQAYITGFRVIYDGVAISFTAGRQRMKVSALRRTEAEQARLQIVKQKNFVQLLAFSKIAGLATSMRFLLRATDIFESSDQSGTFYLRLNEARFATPRSDIEQGRDFVYLDNPELSAERDDVTIGFETEAERDRFGEMLPAAVVGVWESAMDPFRVSSSDPTKLPLPSLSIQSHRSSTLAVHADDHLHGTTDVAPPLHVSTTFRYPSNPADLVPYTDDDDTLESESHVYSRDTAPNTTRLEIILTSLLHAPSLTYTSGLAALHAIYVLLAPRRVSIGEGYHGSHTLLAVHTRLTGLKVLPLDCPTTDLEEGDVVHLETPLNPTGEAYNIAAYAEKAHSRGAHLVVDATFGPPGLQDPFLWGADVVMHSGTKYLGGHSDMLCGVLAVKSEDWWTRLHEDRVALGSVMGSLEGWLGVRSLRTLDLRVRRQSDNAERLVGWLDYCLQKGKTEEEMMVNTVLKEVKHASIQHDKGWLNKQMPNGYGPVFAIVMNTEEYARRLPSLLRCFLHATSLGGVESLIEWRTMSDKTVDRRLIRISVGVEDWNDLKDDLLRGFRELADEKDGEP